MMSETGVMNLLTTTVFAVSALAWPSSRDTIEHRIRALPGVTDAEVSLYSRTMTVTYDDEKTDIRTIISETAACGYRASVRTEDTEIIQIPERKHFSRNAVISLILAGLLFLCSLLPLPVFISAFLSAAVLFLSRSTLLSGLRTLSKRTADDGTMTAVLSITFFAAGTAAAFFHHSAALFYLNAAALPLIRRFFVALLHGEQNRRTVLLEAREKLPGYARVYEDHREDVVHLSDLQKNEIIVLRPGDTVPADGRVVRGYARVDESRLSGKKGPVEKRENAFLYANSVILEGSLSVRIEQLGNTTAMMRFRRMAEKTAEMHHVASPFADFGPLLFPYMLAASLITLAGWIWLGTDPFRALSAALSVAGCASLTAFTLSSSETVIRTASDAADQHILFKDIGSLSGLSRIDALLMEQGGAVTRSEPSVTDFIAAEGVSMSRLEYIAYALLSGSSLPSARAVTRYLRTQKLSQMDVSDFIRMNRSGRRRVSTIGHCTYGTVSRMQEEGIDLSAWKEKTDRFHQEGKRVMLFAEDGRIIGAAAVRCQLLEGAAETVSALQKKEIRVILITSGSESEAEWLRNALHPDEIMIRPEKEEIHRKLTDLHDQDMKTAWLGRGSCGSWTEPADIRIAIDCGTDIDRRECGILLTRDSLDDLLQAIRMSEQTESRIGRLQMAVLFYHVCMVILAGWAFPAFLHVPLPAFLSAGFSGMAAWLVLTGNTRRKRKK